MRSPAIPFSLLLLLAGVSSTLPAEDERYPLLPGAAPQAGRAIWLENCEGCHGYGIAGAPIPLNPDEWAPRLAKGKAVLYEHAINGFYGPDDTMMPERGGNPDLSDEEVKSAVDYMAALADYYIKLQRN